MTIEQALSMNPDYKLSGRIVAIKKESWIKNVVKKLNYTEQQAEEAFKRIFKQ